MVVALALGIGAIVGTVTLDVSSRLINRLHVDHCVQTAALLANKSSPEYQAGENALAELAERMVRTDPLLFVSFMDAEGNLLAAQQGGKKVCPDRSLGGFTPAATIGNPLFKTGDQGLEIPYLDVTYPVLRVVANGGEDGKESGSVLQGYVRIGYSLERTFAEVLATTQLLSGIGVLIAAMTIPLGFFLVRRLAGPLCELASTMGRFADGELEARSHISRSDEIGALARSYNEMADKLEQKHAEISKLNEELEQRVQQRTMQLRELAARDPLTGLYNRRHFNEVLGQCFAEAKRYGTELACMMIDLDHFKAVNDRFGHQIGDDLLVLTAMTISTEMRTSDIAARFGGDEFIILLPQTDTAQARVLAERFTEKLAINMKEQFPACGAKASVGIGCIVDVTTEDADGLIRVADNALYEAKKSDTESIVAREIAV